MTGLIAASVARPRPPSPDDFLVGAAGERFSYCKGKFLIEVDANASRRVVGCSSLLDRATFDAEIELYSAQFAGADRRAIVSMWTLYYFSTLVIGAAVSTFVLGRRLPRTLDGLCLVSDASTGAPTAFLLREELGAAPAIGDPEQEMEALLREHLGPLIEAIASHAGVSQRLLWNNAAAYLSWIVGEIEAFGGAQSPCGKCLMENECWSDGRRNPLYGTIRTCEKDGNCFSCRKVCCLRYALPGVCGCGNLCPLPQGRA